MNVFSACVKTLYVFLVLLWLPLYSWAVEKTDQPVAQAIESQVTATLAQVTAPLATEPLAIEPLAIEPLAIEPLAAGGKVIFFLLLIVGLILLVAWLAGKSRVLQQAKSSEQLKTLAVMPLGIKEKIAVVQVGEKQLVLGITAQQITCLTELDQPLSNEQLSAKPMAFSDLFKKALRHE